MEEVSSTTSDTPDFNLEILSQKNHQICHIIFDLIMQKKKLHFSFFNKLFAREKKLVNVRSARLKFFRLILLFGFMQGTLQFLAATFVNIMVHR